MQVQIGLKFLNAVFTTGCHFKKCMEESDHEQDFSSASNEWAGISYFDISLKYKNNSCAVLIDIYRNNESILGKEFLERKEQLIKICQENNLIPCIFPLNMSFGKKDGPHGYGIYFEKGKGTSQEFTPLNKGGWNLLHAVTSEPVNPTDGATGGPMTMSRYEQYYFATDVAKEGIEKRYGPILIWNDVTPGNEPQLIYHNEKRHAGEWHTLGIFLPKSFPK